MINESGAVQGAGGMAVVKINKSSGSQSVQCRLVGEKDK